MWSVMIPTFNCARFLEQTLLSVLQQDLGEEMMQIEVIDDCSTVDDPEEVVKRVGKGRVNYFRRSVNGGVTKNFNTCIQRAKGELVHILHGDDWVVNGFYEAVSSAFEKNRDIGIVITGCSMFDEKSNFLYSDKPIDSLLSPSCKIDSFLYSNPIKPAGTVIKKQVYDTKGKFDESLIHCADWDMWVRAIHHFGGVYIPDDLACYRIFAGNDTSKLTLSGQNIRDYQRLFIKFKQEGYGIEEKEFSIVLRNTFLNQYRNFRALKLKKSVALYKKEMHRYLTSAEISQLHKETLLFTLKASSVQLLLPFKKCQSFVIRVMAKLKRCISPTVRN